MRPRRVITGHDERGTPVVVADEPVVRSHRMDSVPQAVTSLAWATEPGDAAPRDGRDPTTAIEDFVPRPGGTRFLIVDFPPDEVYSSPGFDRAVAAAERRIASPGLADAFEADNPGMHTTPTVDYAIVMSGEIWLDLGDGQPTQLNAGDVVIQNATRHAWRNLSSEVARVAFVLIGVNTS